MAKLEAGGNFKEIDVDDVTCGDFAWNWHMIAIRWVSVITSATYRIWRLTFNAVGFGRIDERLDQQQVPRGQQPGSHLFQFSITYE